MSPRHLSCLTVLATLLLSGCGYKQGSLMPPGIRTISVPMAENETFRRNLEIRLTDATVQEIMSRTELKIAEASVADSELLLTIIDIDQNTTVEDPTDRINEQRVFVTVRLIWRDLRTGEIIREVEGLQTSDSFVVPLGQNLDLAVRRAFDKMAEAIVNEMESQDF